MTREEILLKAETALSDAASNRSAYLHMLDIISKFHKYDINQQAVLSLYALPDYTAIADERVWEKFFNAHILPDAVDIEIPGHKNQIDSQTN